MAVRQPGQWPPVTSGRAPADYVEDDPGEGAPENSRRACRGTVELAEVMPSGRRRWRNYGLHIVDFNTGGAAIVIADCNFAFARLKIRGAGSVEFRDCNLVRARWRVFDGATLTFVRCNTFGSQAE